MRVVRVVLVGCRIVLISPGWLPLLRGPSSCGSPSQLDAQEGGRRDGASGGGGGWWRWAAAPRYWGKGEQISLCTPLSRPADRYEHYFTRTNSHTHTHIYTQITKNES